MKLGAVIGLSFSIAYCSPANAADKYQFFGTRTNLNVSGSVTSFQSGTNLINLQTGMITYCAANFIYSVTAGTFDKGSGYCQDYAYVTRPSAGQFSFTADMPTWPQPSSNAPESNPIYWLVDNATGIVQVCGTVDTNASGRYRIICFVPSVIPPKKHV